MVLFERAWMNLQVKDRILKIYTVEFLDPFPPISSTYTPKEASWTLHEKETSTKQASQKEYDEKDKETFLGLAGLITDFVRKRRRTESVGEVDDNNSGREITRAPSFGG